MANVHTHEVDKFGAGAAGWWDFEGEFKTLHDINPLRLSFMQRYIDIDGKRIIDVGCGGGILTESLAALGAVAFGIDLSQQLLDVAKLHGLESGVSAHYEKITVEDLAAKKSGKFDHLTCMEMLEHVPDPAAIIAACGKLVAPGGMLFFSTLNRVAKAYLLAIVGGEYLLNMLPKGTHNYNAFIKPSEISQMARDAGLDVQGIIGIQYNPLTKKFSLGDDIAVNYIIACRRRL